MAITSDEKKKFLMIGLVIAVVWLFSPIEQEDMMTFYDHKECLVYGGYMIGCEGSGSTSTYYFNEVSNYQGYGSCAVWMEAHQCRPENCNYMEGGTCGEYDETNVLPRDCQSDGECIQRFRNTGWTCAINPLSMEKECVFQGNHMEEAPEMFGMEESPEEKSIGWEKTIAVAGTLTFMYLIGGLI